MVVIPRGWFISLLAAALWVVIEPTASSAQPPTFLIGKHETWKYSAGNPAPPANWKQPASDNSSSPGPA